MRTVKALMDVEEQSVANWESVIFDRDIAPSCFDVDRMVFQATDQACVIDPLTDYRNPLTDEKGSFENTEA